MKKFTALVMAAIMSMGLMVGCGKAENKTESTKSEKRTSDIVPIEQQAPMKRPQVDMLKVPGTSFSLNWNFSIEDFDKNEYQTFSPMGQMAKVITKSGDEFVLSFSSYGAKSLSLIFVLGDTAKRVIEATDLLEHKLSEDSYSVGYMVRPNSRMGILAIVPHDDKSKLQVFVSQGFGVVEYEALSAKMKNQ